MSMAIIPFITRQFTPLPLPSASFSSQTIIVTGSNVGLGLEAARHFAQLGVAHLILAVRTESKGQAAVEDIIASLPTATASKLKIEVWQLEMDNWDSIKAFVKRCEGLDRLDAVVENAGVVHPIFTLDRGYERTIAVNVIGTFLLALGLLPVLEKSGKKTGTISRLSIVSSEVHGMAQFKEKHADNILAALNDPKQSDMEDRYNVSKLIEVLVVRAISDLLPAPASKHVILNMINPGLCHSSLSRNIQGIQGWIFWLMKLALARRTEVGARTLVAGAAAGVESHGEYMDSCHVEPPSEWVRSAEGKKIQDKVWGEVKVALEEIWPGITKNI